MAEQTAKKTEETTAKAAAAPEAAQDLASKAREALSQVLETGVKGARKAQEYGELAITWLREDSVEAVKTQASNAKETAVSQVKKMDEAIEKTVTTIEERFEPVNTKLPSKAQDMVKRGQNQAREARAKLRERISA